MRKPNTKLIERPKITKFKVGKNAWCISWETNQEARLKRELELLAKRWIKSSDSMDPRYQKMNKYEAYAICVTLDCCANELFSILDGKRVRKAKR